MHFTSKLLDSANERLIGRDMGWEEVGS